MIFTKGLALVDKHSRAVDYPKTGQPANFDISELPKEWPHFMEKKRTYRSEKVLGAMYDEVVKHSPKFDPSWEHAFDKRITKRFELDQSTRDTVKAIKLQYDISVRRILAQHEVQSEFELYTGWCMTKPRIGSDYKRQESLGQEYEALKQRFRDQCYNLLSEDEPEALDKLVAAMYMVTEEEVQAALRGDGHSIRSVESCGGDGGADDNPNMPLISFPWIFHWVLVRIAMGSSYRPGKVMLAAAQRVPSVNYKMRSLFGDPQSLDVQRDSRAADGNASSEATETGLVQGDTSIVEATEGMTNIVVDDGGDDDEGDDEQTSFAENLEVDAGEEAAVDRLFAMMGS